MHAQGQLAVPATLPAVQAAVVDVLHGLAGCASGEDLQSIELGLAEVLSNIARHGFAGREPGLVRIGWLADAQAIRLLVVDDGHAIPGDKLASAIGSPLDFGDTDLADLPEGGLGLALVHRMFDKVDYASEGGVNRMRLERWLR